MKDKGKLKKKTKKISWLSILSILMACILCFGALSSFFTSSYEVQESILNNIYPKPETEPTNEEIISAISKKILTVPENGISLNQMTFSEILSDDVREIRYTPGYANRGGILYGNLSTMDEYLKFYTPDEDNSSNGSYIGFYMLGDCVHPYSKDLSLETYDYITVDLDIWSDNGKYFEDVLFYFQGTDASGNVVTCDSPELMIKTFNGLTAFYSSWGDKFEVIEDSGKPFHLTYVLKLQENGVVEGAKKSETLVYLNGEYLCSVNNFQNMNYLSFFQIFFTKGYENSDVSFCVDNVQVIGFGNGNESYDGPLSELYDDRSITLDKCADSVLCKN